MDKDTSVRTSSGRKKMRINFIDIILILIIVAAVAVLGYIILSPQINISSKAEAVTIQYQVEIVHLREEWKDNVEIGDDFIDYTTMESIGTVVDVRCSDEKFLSVNRDTGELVYVSYPDYITMIITVEAEAVPAGIGYDVNGVNLQIGPDIHFRLPNLCYEGPCKSIQIIDPVVNAGV
jgi:hypothetical protein